MDLPATVMATGGPSPQLRRVETTMSAVTNNNGNHPTNSNSFFHSGPCYAALTPAQIAKAKKVWQAGENARLSTGPLTEEGKRIASQNARKHGYAGATFVLDEEDKQAYAMHLDAYFQSLNPGNQLECDYVRRAANAQWRYDRLTNIETGLLDLEVSLQGPNIDGRLANIELRHYLAIAFMERVKADNALELCRRYLPAAARDCDRAVKMFYLMKAERLRDEATARETAEKVAKATNKPIKPQTPNEPAQNPADGAAFAANGYTNLENYLNSLAP